jgi:hypothetical protein
VRLGWWRSERAVRRSGGGTVRIAGRWFTGGGGGGAPNLGFRFVGGHHLVESRIWWGGDGRLGGGRQRGRAMGGVEGGDCVDVDRGEEGDMVTSRKDAPWRGRRSRDETPKKEAPRGRIRGRTLSLSHDLFIF